MLPIHRTYAVLSTSERENRGIHLWAGNQSERYTTGRFRWAMCLAKHIKWSKFKNLDGCGNPNTGPQRANANDEKRAPLTVYGGGRLYVNWEDQARAALRIQSLPNIASQVQRV